MNGTVSTMRKAGLLGLGLLVAGGILLPDAAGAPPGRASVSSGTESVSHSPPAEAPIRPVSWTQPAECPGCRKGNGIAMHPHHGVLPAPVHPRAPRRPLQYATPHTARPGVGYFGSDGVVNTWVNEEDPYLEPSPFEKFLTDALRQSWIRTEYLHWEVEEPGPVLLGAPLQTVLGDPREPFPVFDNQVPANEIGEAVVPDLDDINFKDTPGIRATWGLPMRSGSFEASFFALEQASDRMSVPEIEPQEETFIGGVLFIDPGFFAATSLLSNGEPSDIVELYNQSFTASYENDTLGTQLNFALESILASYPDVKLQPIVGLRYMLIQENLTQRGVFREVFPEPGTVDPETGEIIAESSFGPPLTSVIESETSNNFLGGTLGLRFELDHKWLTLGFEPSLSVGGNGFSARVRTDNLRSLADPTVVTEEEHIVFAGVGELKAYAQAHLTENFSLHVGYNFLQAMQISRPGENIFYNDRGPFPTPPAVVVDAERTELEFEGLTVGGEIRFK